MADPPPVGHGLAVTGPSPPFLFRDKAQIRKEMHPARAAGGIFHRLDAEWAALCGDADVRVAVADWLVADRLADGVAAVTDTVSDSQVRTPGLALLAALQPGSACLTDERSDAVLRALLRRAARVTDRPPLPHASSSRR
ncbi:hypothetical protein [Streptomyces sp. NPDC056632]|uniref:hypothetical protein n=1 Tax=Streptomyces sp. NPDC056632 TaxID=3345884 RepID=UPI0036CAFF7F